MSGVAESPKKRDFGDGPLPHPWIRQVRAAALQAAPANVLAQRATGYQEQAVQVPDGDAHERCNLDRTQARFRKASVNIAMDPAA